MNLPNLKEARVRSKDKVNIKRDDYVIPELYTDNELKTIVKRSSEILEIEIDEDDTKIYDPSIHGHHDIIVHESEIENGNGRRVRICAIVAALVFSLLFAAVVGMGLAWIYGIGAMWTIGERLCNGLISSSVCGKNSCNGGSK